MYRHRRNQHNDKSKTAFQFTLLAGISCLLLAAAGVSLAGPQRALSETKQATKIVSEPQPQWRALSQMNPVDQQNANIEFETFDNDNPTLQLRLNEIAESWNRGDVSSAIATVRSMEDTGNRFALGISWKSPPAIAKINGAAIGTIGNASNPHLDGHNGTGNAFIALQDSDSSYRWRVYFSSDAGRNWVETYSWNSGVPIVDIGAAVVGDYFYVTYIPWGSPGSARIRRCVASTGAVDSTFGPDGWLEVYDETAADVTEVELASNQEGNNNRLHLFSILSDGRLTYHYTTEDGGDGDLAWTPLDPGVTDAAGNLHTANNDRKEPGSPGGHLFALYRNEDDHIKVFRWKPELGSDISGIAPYFESDLDISAFRDYVVIVHPYDTGTTTGLRCWTSDDAGDTWSYSFLDSGGQGDVSQPKVTLRRGGGIVVAYQQDSWGDDLVFMRTRGYSDLPWTDRVPATDVSLTIDTQMDLEALPEGGFGLVSIHSGGIPWYDQTPLIFRHGFEFGDSVDWD